MSHLVRMPYRMLNIIMYNDWFSHFDESVKASVIEGNGVEWVHIIIWYAKYYVYSSTAKNSWCKYIEE